MLLSRIVLRIFQPPIDRKIRILQSGPEKHYSYKKKKKNLDDHENKYIPMHLIVYSFVLWFTDKKLTYGCFFTFHHISLEEI